MKVGSINSSWIGLSKHLRMDADFWLKVLETVDQRGIDHKDLDSVRVVVKELEEQK